MAESDSGGARQLVKGLSGLDSSGVEVDEEQTPPSIAADSPEEAAELAKMEALLASAGDTPALFGADKKTKLLCLRGRKYDAERAAAALPKLLEFFAEFGIGQSPTEQLTNDVQSHKLISLGSKDADGRAVIWVRLRYHDPKVSKAEDMARLLATVILDALKDPDVQRLGFVLINDSAAARTSAALRPRALLIWLADAARTRARAHLASCGRDGSPPRPLVVCARAAVTGLKLKNLDPAAAKMIMGKVLAVMPVRVGRICVFNPPWVVGHILLPVLLSLLSKKLRGRVAILNGHHPEKLTPYVPKASVPAELGGTLALDEAAWAARVLAALPTK